MQKMLCFLALAVLAVYARPPLDPEVREVLTELMEQVDDHLTQPVMLKFIEKLSDTKTIPGERVVLRCEVTSTPAAVFHWTFNGKRIQGDKHLNVMEKLINSGKKTVESGIVDSEYIIPCATPADAGLYKCIAFNGYETVESQAEIVVEGEDSPCKPTHRAAPIITQWTDSRFEAEGNTATLVCRAHSATKHSITWTFNDDLINNLGGRFDVMENGDLMIRNINWEDMGTYVCIASNKYGEVRAETFLYPSKRLSA